jgi:hypothetical protein
VAMPACLDGALAEVAEAEDELGRGGGPGRAVGAHAVQAHRVVPGRGDHGLLVHRAGQVRHRVEAGGQAAELDGGCVSAQRVHERVAAPGVDGPHAAS